MTVQFGVSCVGPRAVRAGLKSNINAMVAVQFQGPSAVSEQ